MNHPLGTRCVPRSREESGWGRAVVPRMGVPSALSQGVRGQARTRPRTSHYVGASCGSGQAAGLNIGYKRWRVNLGHAADFASPAPTSSHMTNRNRSSTATPRSSAGPGGLSHRGSACGTSDGSILPASASGSHGPGWRRPVLTGRRPPERPQLRRRAHERCCATLITWPSGLRRKNLRIPHGSSVRGCTTS